MGFLSDSHSLTITLNGAAIAVAAITGFCGDMKAGMIEPDEPTGMRMSAAIGRDGVMRYF
jgi:hypothetical protein